MMSLTPPLITPYAAILGLLLVFLSIQVLHAKVQHGQDKDMVHRSDRVQGNFVEYVPMALILLYLLEISGSPAWFLHSLGLTLLRARFAHAWGLGTNSGATYARLFGAQMTFLLISIMSVALLLGVIA